MFFLTFCNATHLESAYYSSHLWIVSNTFQTFI